MVTSRGQTGSRPEARLERVAAGRYALTGSLVFSTVMALAPELREPIGNDTVLDLGGLERVDSAGVALLLQAARECRAAGQTLHFVAAPPRMTALARVYGVEDILAADDAPARPGPPRPTMQGEAPRATNQTPPE